MRIIDIPGGQGSEAWHQHRRDHFNASDAPAMMGCSPYKTRATLLREMHTGLAADVDAATQKRFDAGHRFEALARPLAEKIVGDDLYPITVANGRLSASLDGATMDGKTLFEHKTLSQELRECMEGEDESSRLPLHYRVQMEQQLHCSGGERVLFMASKWDGDTLVEVRHCWYQSAPALRAQIIAGWNQFAEDLAAYVPTEAAPIVAAQAQSLPAVSVRMDGQLAVHSNLPAFGAALKAFVAKIPAKPSTDQEFADTDAACKALKRAEEALDAAESGALASMADVEAMRRMVADFRDVARTARLASEKMVTARKAAIREEEVARGRAAFAAHFKKLCDILGGPFLPPMTPDFAGSIKGLKTLDSVRNAIDTTLANAKSESARLAGNIDDNLKVITAASTTVQLSRLFSDRASLVLKDPEAVAAIVAQRVAEFTAEEAKRMEVERERIRAEEAARIEREQAQLAAAAQACEREDAALKATAAPVYTETPPTLKVGEMSSRLGFTVSREFIASTLGFTPATTEKSWALWNESAWPLICAALAEHVLRCGEKA